MWGYWWVMIFFIGVNIIGLFCNAYLYYIDIKDYDGILNRVDKGEQIQDLLTSPTNTRKEIMRESMAKGSMVRQSLADYKLDDSSRNQLRQSMAARSPNQ